MVPDSFYINNHMTAPLEGFLRQFDSYDDFEKQFSEEFLNEDARIGRYLGDLLYKYDKKASVVSFDAHLNHSYVGNIVNFKKNNPSRDALICIAFSRSNRRRAPVPAQICRPCSAVCAQKARRDHLVWDHEGGDSGVCE